MQATLFVNDSPARQNDASLPYIAGLDGLRAIAIIAVLLYHAGLSVWGGFLGVEAFFVLSGYLITALLLAEWRERGTISIGQFYLRRARRLLPALFLVIVATLAFALIALPEEAASLFDDAAASVFYVMNWFFVFSQQSYFDPMARPSLLQHLWSLAVEEQFYLVWPVLFLVGMRFLRKPGLLIATLVGAVASAWLMGTLYQPDADPSRVYYGTDTRASGILLGAAFAMLWMPGRAPAAQSRKLAALLDLVGLAALAGLCYCFVALDEYHPLLYQGGFAAVALLTVALTAAITHPRTILGRLLGLRPLQWLGTRSYSIYLWHWPVFQVTRPYLDVQFDGWQLLALRLAITLVLAELSYRCVEMPIRRGALVPLWRRVWNTRRTTGAAVPETPTR